MATRLSTYHRRELTYTILQKAFEDREKALEVEGKKLGGHAYERLYPAETRKAMKTALPEGFLPLSETIKVKLSDGVCIQLPLPKPMPFSALDVYTNYPHLNLPKKDALHSLVVAWVGERNAIDNDMAARKAEVHSALLSFSTAEKLIKEWPQIEEYVSKVVGVSATKKLPALPLAQLNKKLNLG